MKYNITLFGNKATTADLARSLVARGHRIDLIVTLAKDVGAAHHIAGSDDLEAVAAELGIAVYATKDYRLLSEEDRSFFAQHTFGIGLCTGWQRLLPEHVLSVFSQGIFGFHGSAWPLPAGRGRSPLNWSIRKGAERVHHNCFRYVGDADAGEIFHTTTFEISALDDIASVQFKALLDMKMVSDRLLHAYEQGSLSTRAQPAGESSWLDKLSPQDGLISFAIMPRRQILDLIRATARPFPGAFARSGEGITVRIWRAIPFEFPALGDAFAAGTLVDVALNQLLIACHDGLILVTEYECAAPLNGAIRFE